MFRTSWEPRCSGYIYGHDICQLARMSEVETRTPVTHFILFLRSLRHIH